MRIAGTITTNHLAKIIGVFFIKAPWYFKGGSYPTFVLLQKEL
jgi:hypothetical protein